MRYRNLGYRVGRFFLDSIDIGRICAAYLYCCLTAVISHTLRNSDMQGDRPDATWSTGLVVFARHIAVWAHFLLVAWRVAGARFPPSHFQAPRRPNKSEPAFAHLRPIRFDAASPDEYMGYLLR